MRALVHRLLAVALCSTLGACAGLTHLTRALPLAPPPGAGEIKFIDAKQRAIIAANVPIETTTYTYDPKTKALTGASVQKGNQLRVCAEPGPDAISAVAASSGLGLSAKDKLNLTQSASMAEATGSIGLRTQSTELTKNPSYRLCEGYLMGALSEGAFETLTRRNQSSTVAILAIEQLTGAVRARQVVLGGSASTGAAQEVLKATELSRSAQTALLASQTELTSAQKLAETLKKDQAAAEAIVAAGTTEKPATTDQKSAAAAAKSKADDQVKIVAGLEKKVAENQVVYDRAEQARVAVAVSPTSATASGAFGAADSDNLDAEAITAVAGSVERIVSQALGLQFSNELCTTVLTADAYGRLTNTSSNVLSKCGGLLDETKSRQAAHTALLAATTAYILKNPDLSADDIKKILDALSGVEKTDPGPIMLTR